MRGHPEQFERFEGDWDESASAIFRVRMADGTGCVKEAGAAFGDQEYFDIILGTLKHFLSHLAVEAHEQSFEVSPCK